MNKQELDAPAFAAAPSLRVLLLVCAGALLVIGVAMAGTIQDAQSMRITQQTARFCGMSVEQYNALPDALQHRINAQCVAEPDAEIQALP